MGTNESENKNKLIIFYIGIALTLIIVGTVFGIYSWNNRPKEDIDLVNTDSGNTDTKKKCNCVTDEMKKIAEQIPGENDSTAVGYKILKYVYKNSDYEARSDSEYVMSDYFDNVGHTFSLDNMTVIEKCEDYSADNIELDPYWDYHYEVNPNNNYCHKRSVTIDDTVKIDIDIYNDYTAGAPLGVIVAKTSKYYIINDNFDGFEGDILIYDMSGKLVKTIDNVLTYYSAGCYECGMWECTGAISELFTGNKIKIHFKDNKMYYMAYDKTDAVATHEEYYDYDVFYYLDLDTLESHSIGRIRATHGMTQCV